MPLCQGYCENPLKLGPALNTWKNHSLHILSRNFSAVLTSKNHQDLCVAQCGAGQGLLQGAVVGLDQGLEPVSPIGEHAVLTFESLP